MNELAQAIINMAQQRGISPRDVGTVVSYETAGTFDPWKAGPTTQWGQHRGLIQWGEPQRQQYGIYQGMPIADQVNAIGRYLDDAGVKPGMGLLDIYSAVNAGRVGRYNASDANNGGAPGTVADKVNYQMAGHAANADKLFGGQLPAADTASPAPVINAAGAAAPTQAGNEQPGLLTAADQTAPTTPATDDSDPMKSLDGLLSAASKMGGGQQQQGGGLLQAASVFPRRAPTPIKVTQPAPRRRFA